MEKRRLQIGLLYLSFHNSLKKIYGKRRRVSERDLIIKLGRQFLVPRRLRILVVRELENMNLIRKESNNEFKILDYDLNIEEDANKFLKKMNLFNIF